MGETQQGIMISDAKREHMPQVLELIHELAAYENAASEVAIGVPTLEKFGFDDPLFGCKVATNPEGRVLGFALYYYKFSTWKGRALYLEDLLVSEKNRRQGIGAQLFKALVAVAKENACGRMEWQVLDWNQPAILFYQKLKSNLDETWINCQLFPNDFERILSE